MSLKIAIDAGHNAPPHDIGAFGIGQEADMNMDVAQALEKRLQDLGYEAKLINPPDNPVKAANVSDSLVQRVRRANAWQAELYVSIHHNSFANAKASGAEVLYVSDLGKHYATHVQRELVALGFKNRTAKQRKDVYVLTNTVCPAILTEACFVTNGEDMKRYSAQTEALAIAKGLDTAFKNFKSHASSSH